MKARLLNYLKNFESTVQITKLKLTPEDLELNEDEVEENDADKAQTPLQLAVQDGRIDVILYLLSCGATIKPVQEETALLHPLAVAILASCYKSKKSSNVSNPIVTAAVHFYAVHRNATLLRDRVAPNLSEYKVTRSDIELSQRQKNAYFYAEKQQALLVTRACDNLVTSYEKIFLHAFENQNHTAMQTILDACRNHHELLINLLNNDHLECALFLIVGTGMDLYQLALSFQKEPELLEQLLNTFFWTKEGLLQGLMARSILPEMPAKDILSLINLLANSESAKEDLVTLFENLIHQRYSLSINLKKADELSDEHYNLVTNLANRFDFYFPSKLKDEINLDLPDGVLDIIFNCCEEKEKLNLKLGGSARIRSRLFRLFRLEFPEEYEKNCQIKHLSSHLKLLNDFIQPTVTALESKTRFSDCPQLLPTKEKLFLIVVTVGFIISCGFLIPAELRSGEIRDILRVRSCWNGRRQCYDPVGYIGSGLFAPCSSEAPECLEYYSLQPSVIGGSVGVGISSACILFQMIIFFISFSAQQPQRFNDLLITDFKSEINTAAKALFSEFKGTELNPFENSTLKSKIGDVLAIAKQIRDDKQTLLNSLTDTKPLPKKTEITKPEVKESNLPEDNLKEHRIPISDLTTPDSLDSDNEDNAKQKNHMQAISSKPVGIFYSQPESKDNESDKDNHLTTPLLGTAERKR